jgi:release factor glutamine methyltransferase
MLVAAGIHNADREMRWLAEVVDTDDALLQLSRRRAAGEPLQYLTGRATFRYIELAVGPGVLVPRPETEIVAAVAMDLLPTGGRIVDVGTGSGAIALAVAHERPDAEVWATEISDEALVWAERNRDSLGKSVRIVKGDLFEGIDPGLRGAFDVVVSNPPYVAPEERDSLPRDVVDHEPAIALFADGDGTSTIERLAREAIEWEKAGGWLVLEIGETQADAVTSMLEGMGYLDVAVRPDLSGMPRIAIGMHHS